MPSPATVTFGTLLRQLRKRAGMTQGDLAAAVGYSVSFVSDLEQNRRLPAVAVILQQFVPALGLQDETGFATQLVERAALARGERPPPTITLQRTSQVIITDTFTFQPSHLPAQPTELIGREQEIKILCNRLQGHSGRLLTLAGPPGVGKTRLGLAVAAQLEGIYRDGALFVPLAAIDDPDLVAAALVAALKISDMSQKPPTVKLIEFLRRKEMLLLLDNFEQITAASGLVAELLAACPGLRILVTSRERLHLRAEQRYQVPPLALVVAVELFTQRAQAVDFAFELTVAQQPIIEAICQRLDCLPLAIELIAAQIDLFSPLAMLERLHDQGLDLLNDGPHDAPVRHRTLRNAIHRSYVLCSHEEQRLFRTLGVFVGSFDLMAVAHFGFAEPTLQALIHKNLVKVEGQASNTPRFLLLETLREYALEQLAQTNETKAVQRTHALYFFELIKKFDMLREEGGIDSLQYTKRIERDLDNLRASLSWLTIREPALEIPFLNYMFSFINFGHHMNEGYHWFETALRRSKPEQTLVYASFLWVLTTLRLRQGNLDEAQTYAEESLALFRQMQQPDHEVVLLNLLSEILLLHGDYIASYAVAEESVVIARKAGKPVQLAGALYGLWMILIQLGDLVTAHMTVNELVSLWRSVSDPFYHAAALEALALDAFLRSELSLARAQGEEALQRYRSFDQPCSIASTLAVLGKTIWCQGDKVQSAALLAESLTLIRELGMQAPLYPSLLVNGLTTQKNGDLHKAQALLTECLTLAQETKLFQRKGNLSFVAYILSGLAGQLKISEQAARLLGFASSLLTTKLVYLVVEHSHYERILATVRAQLDEVTFTAAYAEGYAMTPDQAVAVALAHFAQTEPST